MNNGALVLTANTWSKASGVIDSIDPAYGSGSSIGGVGLVFVLGVSIIGVGIVIMIWNAIRRPAFFRGETLAMDAPPSLRRR